jgi:hypothetical protein
MRRAEALSHLAASGETCASEPKAEPEASGEGSMLEEENLACMQHLERGNDDSGQIHFY